VKLTTILLILLLLPAMLYSSEKVITVSTYYPSPYGSYSTLSTKILVLVPQETAPAGQEGALYYDSVKKSIWFHNDIEWIELGGGGEEIILGTFSRSSDAVLSGGDWKAMPTGWDHSGAYVIPSGDNYVFRVNLESFGRGFYQVVWSGAVEIDAIAGKYVQVRLLGRRSGGDWFVIDTSEIFEDGDGLKNSVYDSHVIEERLVTLAPSKVIDFYEFKFQAKKNANDTNASAIVKTGTTMTVSRTAF
jgi:hypothetical protein